MSKQTAVEWLVEKYDLVGMLTPPMIDQAKAMEREQIQKAYSAFHKKLKCDCGNIDDVKEIAICVNCYNNGEW